MNLNRFVEAQSFVWERVAQELINGKKVSHWMWFIFPQLQSLGTSKLSLFYGITNREEAFAYSTHEVLGSRLCYACYLLNWKSADVTAVQIFGEVDAAKLRACLTLFSIADPAQPVYGECLKKFFESPDVRTVELLDSRL